MKNFLSILISFFCVFCCLTNLSAQIGNDKSSNLETTNSTTVESKFFSNQLETVTDADPAISRDPNLKGFNKNGSGKSMSFLRGIMAQACFYDYDDDFMVDPKHVEFDTDNVISTMTIKTGFNIELAAGEYYNGIWYGVDYVNDLLLAIDPETGTYTEVEVNAWGVDMAFDYSNETMYSTKGSVLYTVDLTTGTHTVVGTFSGNTNALMTLAIDLEGNMYGIELITGILYSIDKSSLECTEIGNTGLNVSYRQSMGFDHNTGILYWAQYSPDTEGNFYSVNVASAEVTLLGEGVGEMIGLFIPYTASQEIAEAPTDFIATPIDEELAADLSWKNPTLTIDGEPISEILSVVLERNGTIIKEFDNAEVGEEMDFTDNEVPYDGVFSYKVYVITDAGNGKSATTEAAIGHLCELHLDMADDMGDGWQGSHILITCNDITYGTAAAAGASTLATILIPTGTIDFTWVSATAFDSDASFSIYNHKNVLIYQFAPTATGPNPGLFFTYENDCNDIDSCDPVTELSGEYNNDTKEVYLEWTAPAAKAGPISYEIFRDESYVASVNSDETSYTDDVEGIPYGSYNYCVTAMYETCASEETCTVVNFIGINEYSSLKIYPNPTNTVINITGENITDIQVFNYTGQQVANYGNVNIIDVSSYKSGIYILNITTENGKTERCKVVVR